MDYQIKKYKLKVNEILYYVDINITVIMVLVDSAESKIYSIKFIQVKIFFKKFNYLIYLIKLYIKKC